MITEFIKDITETVEGYNVKNLKWNKIDNVIVGQVQCPILGRKDLHEGFIVVTWHRTGKLTSKYGGKNREDLNLKMNYEN